MAGEGDQWFLRNRHALDAPERARSDVPLALTESLPRSPRSILEIGASNGWRLELLRKRFGADCHAVEPSRAAINDGHRRYPRLRFHRGTVDRLPSAVRSRRFDLVIVHFVLHWVSRDALLRAAAEIDGVVAADGFLLLGDFLPKAPERTAYHHLPGRDVWTFKQDYAAIFLASALYRLVVRRRARHAPPAGSPALSSTAAVSLLVRNGFHH